MMGDIPRPDKVEFGALANGPTRELYASLPESVTTVILCGVESHICIYQTAVGILALGKHPGLLPMGSRRVTWATINWPCNVSGTSGL